MSNNEFDTDGQSESHHETAPMRSREGTGNGADQSNTTTIPDVQQPRQRSGPVSQEQISEIFQKKSTITQIKSSLVIFFATGLGIGLAGFAIVGSSEIRGVLAATAIIALALIGPVLGVLTGTRIGSVLSDEPAIQAYATTAVSTIGGHILYFIVAFILIAANTATSLAVSDFLAPMFIGAIGTAIAGTASVYAVQELNSSTEQRPRKG